MKKRRLTETGWKGWLKSIERDSPKNWKTFVFFLRLFLLSIPFRVLLNENWTLWLRETVAGQTAWLLNRMGEVAVAEGFWVYTAQLSINVIPACTGWRSSAAFGALVLAVPDVGWRKRADMIFGMGAIYLVNLVRMTSLAFMPLDYVEFIHQFFWRNGMLIVVLFLWIGWLSSIDC